MTEHPKQDGLWIFIKCALGGMLAWVVVFTILVGLMMAF